MFFDWKNLLIIIFLCSSCQINKPIQFSQTLPENISCDGSGYFIENLCNYEKELLDKARKYKKYPQLKDLTEKALLEISRKEQDIDFASAVFYDRMIRQPRNYEFLQELKQLAQKNYRVNQYQNSKIHLYIIPGMFYKDNTGIGARGEYLTSHAFFLGIPSVVVPIGQLATVEQNAQVICQFIANHPQKSIIASISKGGADFKLATQLCGSQEYFSRVVAWINLGGLTSGTYLVEQIEKDIWLYWQTRYYFWKNNFDYESLSSIAKKADSTWQKKWQKPPHLPLVNITGVPTRLMLTKRAIPMYNLLKIYGPNEGMNLLADSYLSGGVSLPLWRNDHYFRVLPGRQETFALFAYLLQQVH